MSGCFGSSLKRKGAGFSAANVSRFQLVETSRWFLYAIISTARKKLLEPWLIRLWECSG